MKTWQEVVEAYNDAWRMYHKWCGRHEKTELLWRDKLQELERRYPRLLVTDFRNKVERLIAYEQGYEDRGEYGIRTTRSVSRSCWRHTQL